MGWLSARYSEAMLSQLSCYSSSTQDINNRSITQLQPRQQSHCTLCSLRRFWRKAFLPPLLQICCVKAHLLVEMGRIGEMVHPCTPEWELLAHACSPCCWWLQVVGCWDCCCGENCDCCCCCWSGLKISEPPGSCWRLKTKGIIQSSSWVSHCPRMNTTWIMMYSLEVCFWGCFFFFKKNNFKINHFTIAVVREKAQKTNLH